LVSSNAKPMKSLLGIAKKAKIKTKAFVYKKRAKSEKVTPLSWACRQNDIEIVEYFLRDEEATKKSINHPCKMFGCTPIYWACENSNFNMVELLIKNGAKTNQVDDFIQETPLLVACKKNNIDIVQLLIQSEAKVDINEFGYHKETPLYWACRNNNIKMVKLLIQYGTKIELRDIDQTNDQKIEQYLRLVKDFDESKDKIKFIKDLKNKKNKEDILEVVFFRSAQKVLNNNKKYKSTLLFEIFKKSKIDCLLNKKIEEATSFKITENTKFKNFLASLADKNKSNLARRFIEKIIKDKDLEDRAEFILNM